MTDAQYEADRQKIVREMEAARRPFNPAAIRPGSRQTPPGAAFFADMRAEAEEQFRTISSIDAVND